MRKKIKPLLVSILLLIACIPLTTFLSEEYEQNILPPTDEFTLAVNIENDGLDYRMNWWQSRTAVEDEYFVAIPGSLKNNRHKLAITGVDSVEINGKTYKNNSTLDNITEGLNSLSADGVDYKLYVYYTGDIPSVHIATESGNLEHIRKHIRNKEAGSVQIIDGGKTLYTGDLKYVKGRGNTSWGTSHMGFNIKFDKKINLFNMGAAKKWSLLTPFRDVSYMKNEMAYKMSEILQMEFTPQQQHVDLYINGDYWGIYMLNESVEIDENRIPIFSLEDLLDNYTRNVNKDELTVQGYYSNPDSDLSSYKWVNFPKTTPVINGGYVLEYDLPSRYAGEKCGFVSAYGQMLVVKHPEYVPQPQVELMYNHYQDFENSIMSRDGYNDKGMHYSDYLDVDSMVSSYIVQEWSKNLDAGGTSFYLYKDVNEKYVAGPVWDFDVAFGYPVSRYGIDLLDPVGPWAYDLNVDTKAVDREVKTILSQMCAHDEFMVLVREKWENVMLPQADTIIARVDELAEYVEKSMFLTKLKWEKNQDYRQAVSRYEEEINKVKNFVTTRQKFLTEFFTEKTENK